MSTSLIQLDEVTVTYPDQDRPALRHVDLAVEEGELVLVIGRTGSGKSTLLGTVNGAVPHFTGGILSGRVVVAGLDTRQAQPRDLAGVVGVVGQDPLAGFVTDTVEEELAYGMEQLGLEPAVMRTRVEETLDLLGIAELRDAPLRTLSGGQQQRAAIGAVLTAHPRILILDEPTSALDPTAAEEVLATVTRLVHDLGVTVLLAEHRIERVVHAADRIVEVRPDGTVRVGAPAAILADAAVAPPIVELGRYAGWSPLPLSVRDARRHAADLRATLPGHIPPRGPLTSLDSPGATDESTQPPSLQIERVTVRYGDLIAVREVSLPFSAGTVTALMGRNGSGKSSLMWAIQGSGPRSGGRVALTVATGPAADPAALDATTRRRLVGLVPQSATDLLYLDSVAGECATADRESQAGPGTCRALLDRFAPGIPDERHPRDLSEGQRLALVLAVQLTADPGVVLLDEPTRGLDYDAKAALTATLRELAAAGRTVVVATHDVEFVAQTADRVVVMAAGEVVADAQVTEALTASPAFSPQVAKILAPLPYLTVAQVAGALERR